MNKTFYLLSTHLFWKPSTLTTTTPACGTEEFKLKHLQILARKKAVQELAQRMANRGEPISPTLQLMLEEEEDEEKDTCALWDGYQFGTVTSFQCVHPKRLDLNVVEYGLPNTDATR